MRREDKERRKKEGAGRLVHRGPAHRRVEGFYGRSGEMEYEFAKAWEKQNIPIPWMNFGHGTLQNLLIKEDTRHGLFHKPILWVNGRDAAVAAEVIQWLGTNCGLCFLRQVLEASGYTLEQARNTRSSDFYEEMTATSRLQRLLPKLSRVEIYRRLVSLSPGGYADVCGKAIYYSKSSTWRDGKTECVCEKWACSSAGKDTPVYNGVTAGQMARWLYDSQDTDISEARAALQKARGEA